MGGFYESKCSQNKVSIPNYIFAQLIFYIYKTDSLLYNQTTQRWSTDFSIVLIFKLIFRVLETTRQCKFVFSVSRAYMYNNACKPNTHAQNLEYIIYNSY